MQTHRMLEAWSRVERWLVGCLGLVALAIGNYQVASRYAAPQLMVSWTDEVVTYLFVWGIFIICSVLVAEDGHVRSDIVLRLLSPSLQRWTEVFNCLVALGFCAGLTLYGSRIVSDAYDLGERSGTQLGFPMWLYYAALPVGAALMSVRYVIRLYRYGFQFDPATMTVDAHHGDKP